VWNVHVIYCQFDRFDFVEIHAAHGYLFDQFFCSTTNLRADEFGPQSIENRTRALGLVLTAVIKEMGGSHRVAIRVSPTAPPFAYQGCVDANPQETYRGVIKWLNQFKLAYLLISEPRWNGGRGNANLETDQTFNLPLANSWVKSVYDGVVIGSSSFSPASAEKAIQDGIYDTVGFGRLFISNPDLVERIRRNLPLNLYDVNTFYVRDQVVGYVDYPEYSKAKDFPKLEQSAIGSKKPAKL
jgi:N-ethylmaleimide reductase